jgi:hypothetical protein
MVKGPAGMVVISVDSGGAGAGVGDDSTLASGTVAVASGCWVSVSATVGSGSGVGVEVDGRGVGVGGGGGGVLVGFTWGAPMMTGVGVGPLGVRVTGGKSPPGTDRLQATNTNTNNAITISNRRLIVRSPP